MFDERLGFAATTNVLLIVDSRFLKISFAGVLHVNPGEGFPGFKRGYSCNLSSRITGLR